MGCSCCEERETACRSDTCDGGHAHGNHHGDKPEGRRALLEVRLLAVRFIVASLLFGAGLALSLTVSAGEGSGSIVPIVVKSLFVLSWLVAGYRVVFNALRNILRGDFFDENFLMSVATIGAFIIGQWPEGSAVMLFYNLGEMVQESAVNRSRRSITDLMDVRPDVARLDADGSEVHPGSVPEGTLIRVLPGEKVPLDGMIVTGSSSFDTSRLTGESLPREASPGSEALAGFVNGSGLLVIRTTATFGETAAAKMLELIENAQNRKAKAEKLITSFAKVYTPIVTVAAALLAILPPVIIAFVSGSASAEFLNWNSFAPWVSRGLVFLVISCPCAFVISVPLGFFGGIGGAARSGILVKGADYIDVLAKAKAVVFDKTGTLTHGVFSVRSVIAVSGSGDSDREELVRLAAIAEFHSTHPVGTAIRSYADRLGIAVEPDGTEYAERAGYGVAARYRGQEILAGSRKLLEDSGISGLPSADSPSAVSGTLVEIARGGIYSGRIVLGDEPKEDAARAVAALKEIGIDRVVMLTGDTESAARQVSAAIGIDEVRSGVLPHRKVEYFEEVSAAVKKTNPGGTILFVGDGINDAPVLARADAGIAMGGIGSDAAIEAADVVLMNDNPSLVAAAVRSARWTRRIVSENIALSFIIKVGFLALGAFGIATLWEAVFADVGVALLATLNALRARRRFSAS
jgi:Cd2+/Zn2+-exporting ATPase